MNIDRARVGDWMQTYTGRQFWPIDPRAEEIFIEDIAHSLSLQCRYAGHCINFYSVAEHCVHVSRAVPPEDALWGLLHDAAEAYLVDVPRPLKPFLNGYKFREQKVMRAVAERFGLKGDQPASVSEIDTRILLDERAQNMTATSHDWRIQGQPLNIGLGFWPPDGAEYGFLARFHELTA